MTQRKISEHRLEKLFKNKIKTTTGADNFLAVKYYFPFTYKINIISQD